MKKSLFKKVEPYLYLVPALILFTLFVYWPFLKTLKLSTARTTPLGGVAEYVGLSNYISIFKDPKFIQSLVVSFEFAALMGISFDF